MMTMMTQKAPDIFICEKCDFVCSKKRDYERHLLTRKHKNDDKKAPKSPQNYDCDCGKSFKYRQGLYVHKKSCKMDKNIDIITDVDIINGGKKIDEQNNIQNVIQNENTICSDENISITREMFMTLLKDNQEMMKMIKSLSEQQLTTTQHITNNNNNNNITNNFNLNIFLNEKCKDALNMSEFIDSLKITLDDLLFSKDNGITRGVTDIMMKRLRELDIYKRPIHCTDIKRDTMYIKDEDKWHKDNNHNKFKNTIVKVANKERSALQQWALDNPDWIDTEQKQIQYLTMVRSICEPIETYNNYERKIVKNIGKEILVDK
jgi:hypothetical protein